jgi:magnesium transporter
VAALLDLPDLAMRDALRGEARTRVEVHDGVAFVALQPARYVGHGDGVETSDVGIFVGSAFIVTVQRGETAVLDEVRAGPEPGQAVHGPFGLLHDVIARVVDGYSDVAAAIDEDLDDIERMVFGGSDADHSERIYMRMRSVLLFRRAAASLVEPLERLADETPGVPAPVVPFLRHVHGHAMRIAERCEAHDRLLTAVLAAELAQVSVRQNRATAKQNEDVRRISAWAAIGLVPTAIAGLYGMNFEHMPELGWRYGYPVVVAVIATVCLSLHRSFHRNGWL